MTIEEKEYFRVRLGPYESRRKVKNISQELEEQGIRGMMLKVTEP